MLTKMLTAVVRERARPSRASVEPLAADLVRRHGASIMAVARRYAATPEDAEDAYQRGLEILLTKAPSVHEDDLLPWLKTVVKHEAFSLYRKRERDSGALPASASASAAADTHERVERLDRLGRGAEAMGRLKPAEVRCLLLRAEGHSYRQISEITGFSYTKVNRCLSEGRAAFTRSVERIESGAECERLAPLLSALADGEATARDMAVLRPHLRTCLTCRAALRDAREVPARVASVAPLGFALPSLRGWWDWLHDRLVGVAVRGQDLIEVASSHKLAAAAAASAAAIGGGAGIAAVDGGDVHRHHSRPSVRVTHAHAAPAPRWRPAAAVVTPPPASPVPRQPERRTPRQPPATVPSPPPPTQPPPAAAAAPRVAPPTRTEQRRSPAPAEEDWTGEFGP
jgi:RNA polymerase sigma factor (sigma-70 family)